MFIKFPRALNAKPQKLYFVMTSIFRSTLLLIFVLTDNNDGSLFPCLCLTVLQHGKTILQHSVMKFKKSNKAAQNFT